MLGGDHLGPHRWRDQPAETAMAHAEELVRSYVAAGYTKLHLDCSYPCADDEGPLDGEVMAARAARMLVVAEEEAARVGLTGALRYVIGTEVPVPGGADHEIAALVPTSESSARATLQQHRDAFERAGMSSVWPQVMALVVQPGVEFDHLRVVDYRSEATRELRTVLDDEPAMVFEAHSTDYQTLEALTTLVTDGWGVLKVGPGLTFALREALFALAAIEDELVPAGERSRLPAVVEERMLDQPDQWQRYYTGTAQEQAMARRYSYSDRMRYYWPDPEIEAAVDDAAGEPHEPRHPRPAAERLPPRSVRTGPVRGARWHAPGARGRPCPRRPAHLRRGRHPPLTRRSGPCPWSSSG